MMLTKTAAAFALGLGLVAGAHATVTPTLKLDLGGISGTPEFKYGDTFFVTSDFADVFSFSITARVDSTGSANNASFVKNGVLTQNITGLNVAFYQETSHDGNFTNDLWIGNIGNPGDAYHYGFGTYEVGNYYYVISGVGSGLNSSGAYTIGVTGTAAPVPEPETYAMLLAGLGLMGTIARRRNKAKAG